ncbi:MAG: GTPase [Polaromonas sp.]|nr:GTPase [Polaromonas sp.]
MTPEQQEALLSIALFAAFADGTKADAEREEIRRIAESLSTEANAPNLPRLYQDVLLKRIRLDSAVQKLVDASHRQLAYEMAVCVCDADGQQTDAERTFLADLRQQLALSPAQTQAFDAQAAALAEIDRPATALPVPAPLIAAVPAMADEAELDRSILNHALVNGALELLPQSWASMAIIPLQVKMVYGIGKAHGVTLDQGHVKEFIAAAGVGLTSQYLEQIGRKLLGGLLGKMAGRTIGKVGSAGTGMAFSFATTYALGQLAKRYYAGGRVMNTALLRETYQGLLEPAKKMQADYLPQIQQKAATLDAGQVMAMVRGA